MLVRFLVKNLFSFNDLTEFNMVPGRFGRLPQHIYHVSGMELLKQNILYGANGAGKSNLINAIAILKDFVIDGEMPIELITETFKFNAESKERDVYLGIEFIKDEIPFYYYVVVNQGIIIEEELQVSGLEKKEDHVLFSRTDFVGEKRMSLVFSESVIADKEAALFPEFLENEILQRNTPVLFYMKGRQNEVFAPFRQAFEWFQKGLEVILPSSRPHGLPLRLEKDESFREFSVAVMKTFDTGIEDIFVETIPLEHFFGEENKLETERISAELRARPESVQVMRSPIEEVNFVMQDGKAYAKRVSFSHREDGARSHFQISEESDGTRRLMDYLPALFTVVSKCKTYLIDEVERSIHPLLIKELVSKFSLDPNTRGQLIMSTHESNLLDQEIFRPDEIWFAKKNEKGGTELFSLSEFKEHHTIDIRKGYLNGRYGAIPFLGNLKDLNWDKYAEAD